MRKKLISVQTLLALVGILCCFSSCVSSKEVVYLQDTGKGTETQTLNDNYQTLIQKDDLLRITVSSKQPELTAPFNTTELGSSGESSNKNNGYLVNSQGEISLPIIGNMRAAGKTCTQLGKDIAKSLSDIGFITDATANVQIANFKYSVLGEVNHPGTFSNKGERLTILEALSQAGDLNIDGNRNVTLIREENGKREISQLDLRSKSLFDSPYYYIHQNDVIYVTPSHRKINMRSDAAQWYGWGLSGFGVAMAIIALCFG